MTGRVLQLIRLWVHAGQETAFEAFEAKAAAIMARHGGRIDAAMRVGPDEQAAADQKNPPFEIHMVSFPDEASRQAYRLDPETIALGPERQRIISRTLVQSGWPAGPYSS